MAETGAAVAVRKQGALKALLTDQRVAQSLAAILPKHMSPERLVRLALLAAVKNPKLYEAKPESVLQSLMQAAALGLEPDGTLGSAYLVTFKDNRQGGILVCQLMPGYRGLIDLARRAGGIVGLEARLVFPDDHFDVEYGTQPRIHHKPNLTSMKRVPKEHTTAAYAVATFPGGHQQFEVMMRNEIEDIRRRSRAGGEGPWVHPTDYGEMAKKCPVRRISKYLPLSPQLAAALELEHRIDTGEATSVDPLLDTEQDMIDHVTRTTAARVADLAGRLNQEEGSHAT
jgi:recombination protein RecT